MLTTIAAYALIGLFFGAVERRRQGPAARSLRPGRFDAGSQRVLALGIVTVQLGLIAGPVLNHLGIGRLPGGEAIGWMGVALMVGGIALRDWAGRSLGGFYSRTLQVQAGQQVVDAGSYRVIRHPGYVGALLLWIGAVCATTNGLAIAIATPAITAAYVYRIRCEEAMLSRVLDEPYRKYQTRTWRLIPHVY